MILNSLFRRTLSAHCTVGVFSSHRNDNIKASRFPPKVFSHSFITKLLPTHFRKQENRESYKEHKSSHFSTDKK